MKDLVLFMQRDKSREDEMLGELFIVDENNKRHFECYTLEDEFRLDKIPGETAIPAGRYEIKIRPYGESRLDAKYIERFGHVGYRGQIWLQDVPNFTYVYIHCGNNESHTNGCILVGQTKYIDAIGASRPAYANLYTKISDALTKGRRVFIDIHDAIGGAV